MHQQYKDCVWRIWKANFIFIEKVTLYAAYVELKVVEKSVTRKTKHQVL